MTIQSRGDFLEVASAVGFDTVLFDRLIEQLPGNWRFKSLSAERGAAIRVLIEDTRDGRINLYELDPVFQQFRLIRNVVEGDVE